MKPSNYILLSSTQRRLVREAYIKEQNDLCMFCNTSLSEKPPNHITTMPINWDIFPRNFLKHPVHLQHNHDTGLTEGAVHAYCNAILWQYHGR
jgi:hypothetical protein